MHEILAARRVAHQDDRSGLGLNDGFTDVVYREGDLFHLDIAVNIDIFSPSKKLKNSFDMVSPSFEVVAFIRPPLVRHGSKAHSQRQR